MHRFGCNFVRCRFKPVNGALRHDIGIILNCFLTNKILSNIKIDFIIFVLIYFKIILSSKLLDVGRKGRSLPKKSRNGVFIKFTEWSFIQNYFTFGWIFLKKFTVGNKKFKSINRRNSEVSKSESGVFYLHCLHFVCLFLFVQNN